MFGESVLNDAVAIVLFRTFLREYQENESFTAGTLPSTLLSFFTITLASTSVGVLIGLACSFLFKHTRIRDYPKFEISLLFLSSYGSYAFAEAVELSGIMSIFFTGVVLATYNTYNLSPTSQVLPTEGVIFFSAVYFGFRSVFGVFGARVLCVPLLRSCRTHGVMPAVGRGSVARMSAVCYCRGSGIRGCTGSVPWRDICLLGVCSLPDMRHAHTAGKARSVLFCTSRCA